MNSRMISLVLLLAAFGSYCQMAPAAGAGQGELFKAGTGHMYRLESTVLLNEAGGGGKDVGYQVVAGVVAATVWQSPYDPQEKLLRMEVTSPQLHIKSRKAPAPDGFITHSSRLDELQNGPFLVHWNRGRVEYIYVAEGEELSLVNLKKGIASLFQFQILDVEQSEKDASGKCEVSYKTVDPVTFMKTKKNCVNGKMVPLVVHPDRVMGADVVSKREAKYVLSRDQSVLQSVMTDETHEMTVVMRKDAGNFVQATQELTLTDSPVSAISLAVTSLQEAVAELELAADVKFAKQILVTEREHPCQIEECPKLSKLVKENIESLSNDNLGTTKSAATFLRLVSAARQSKKDDITKVLKSSKNKDIILQLSDLVGAIQTQVAHEAAMKVFHLDMEDELDQNERYFWSLSFGSHPNPLVLKDVLRHSESSTTNEKLSETLILTAAAMTNKFIRVSKNREHKIVGEVIASLEKGLADCVTEECKQKFLRAFRNLGMEETIPTLLEYALNGTRKTSVTAMKALRSLPPSSWNATVLKAAHNIYYQIPRRFDSSARTLAVDILLESNPNKEVIQELLLSLTSSDPVYEVKQYLLQRLWQISEKDSEFKGKVQSAILEEHKRLNNYHALAQRGLSTAFTRYFMNNPSVNGSLVTIQEISSGLLKRGIVDVVLENGGHSQDIFTLGLFAGGLGSFISSSDDENKDEDDDEPEEPATAGMEVSVLGVQIRPFVFFSGQGELMGHVWSGTASEKTPAFQSLALLHDHLQYIPLQSGFITKVSLLGAVSFDLSGQIQLSLWNRNAHSLVEKNAGVVLQGQMRVDTSFVRSQVEFSVATEARLNLVSDINFSNNVALCLQLRQPDSILRHNVFKVERIPGSKHRLRKAKYRVQRISGQTYALNQKNNEMCNVIHKV